MHVMWLVDLRNVGFLLKLPSDLDKRKNYSGHQAALTNRTETVSPPAVQEEKPGWLLPRTGIMCVE